MAWREQAGEKNEDNDLYEKSGDEDDRLRKEYHSICMIHEALPDESNRTESRKI